MVYLTVYCQMPLDQHLLIKKHLQDRCVVLMRGRVKDVMLKLWCRFFIKKEGLPPPTNGLLKIIFNFKMN